MRCSASLPSRKRVELQHPYGDRTRDGLVLREGVVGERALEHRVHHAGARRAGAVPSARRQRVRSGRHRGPAARPPTLAVHALGLRLALARLRLAGAVRGAPRRGTSATGRGGTSPCTAPSCSWDSRSHSPTAAHWPQNVDLSLHESQSSVPGSRRWPATPGPATRLLARLRHEARVGGALAALGPRHAGRRALCASTRGRDARAAAAPPARRLLSRSAAAPPAPSWSSASRAAAACRSSRRRLLSFVDSTSRVRGDEDEDGHERQHRPRRRRRGR